MYSDWLGNPVTAASDATLAGIDDFLQGYLGYEVKAGNIFAAADADADCAIANAYAAICNMYPMRRSATCIWRRRTHRRSRAAIWAGRGRGAERHPSRADRGEDGVRLG